MRGFLLLVAIVLASIGVGVGVEAATQPMIYGPHGAQFTAAFPAPPTVTSQEARVHGVSTLNYAAGGPSHQLSVTVTEARSGWTGYAPVTPAYHSVAAIVLTKDGPSGLPRQLSLRPTRLDGQWVELGVSCRARSSCVGVLFGLLRRVDHHLVEWSATALARSPSSAHALVTSLRPVSGAVPASTR